MLQEVTRPSTGARAGAYHIATTGRHNAGFGGEASQLPHDRGSKAQTWTSRKIHTRKPVASLPKIVKMGDRVVVVSDRSYIERVQTGNMIEPAEENGTLDVDFLPWVLRSQMEPMNLACFEECVSPRLHDFIVLSWTPGSSPTARMRAGACRGSPAGHGAFTAFVNEKEHTGHQRQEAKPENAIPEVQVDCCFMGSTSEASTRDTEDDCEQCVQRACDQETVAVLSATTTRS